MPTKMLTKEEQDLYLKVIVPLRTGRPVTKEMAKKALESPYIGGYAESVRERLRKISEGPP